MTIESQTNSESQHFVLCGNVSNVRAYNALNAMLDIMQIELPADLSKEGLTCETAGGLVEMYLRTEVKTLCRYSDVLNNQIAYVDITKEQNEIIQRKIFYMQHAGRCLELYNRFFNSSNTNNALSCPLDSPFSYEYDGVWLDDWQAIRLMRNERISSPAILLEDVICKLGNLSMTCDSIIGYRQQLSADKERCGELFLEFVSQQKFYIGISVQKNIDDKELDSLKKRKAYAQKVMKRLNRNPLYEQYGNYLYDKSEFAYYLVNESKIDKGVVLDFIMDVEILDKLKYRELEFPFLKEEYHHFELLDEMLLRAYQMCVSAGGGFSDSEAYCVIWYWMINDLKIAVSGKSNGILMYTNLMNRLTKNSLDHRTIANIISENKKKDYSTIMHYLGAVSFSVRLNNVKS